MGATQSSTQQPAPRAPVMTADERRVRAAFKTLAGDTPTCDAHTMGRFLGVNVLEKDERNSLFCRIWRAMSQSGAETDTVTEDNFTKTMLPLAFGM